MALIVLLSAAIYPNIEAMYGDSKVTASGDMIRAAWAEAQAHAMNEGRPYRFAVRWRIPWVIASRARSLCMLPRS